jgi:hypothetical protein
MKVSGTRSSSATGGARSASKTGGVKGEFKAALVDAMDDAPSVFAAEAPPSLGAVDALLVAQAVGDSPDKEQRRRLVRHAEDILDMLEELRHGLLMGTIPESKLTQLTDMVRSRREACRDPRLASLLDEIELRAEVELAKLSRN